jgi:hypothetical protein
MKNRPTARSGHLAITVGKCIYCFGGRNRDNRSLTEKSFSIIHVFDTEVTSFAETKLISQSFEWRSIHTTPPAEKCGEIYLYGTLV